jgi:hypothetical protein
MIKYFLLVFLINSDNPEEIKESRYAFNSQQECLIGVGKAAIAISGEKVYFQTVCVSEKDLERLDKENAIDFLDI